MRAAHLFDGIGGIHIAADRAGMETLWVSEWAPPTWKWDDPKDKKRELAAMRGMDPDEVLLSTHPDYGARHGRWVPDGQWAAKVSKTHWPEIPNLGDIHGITDAPRVDVLTGGFPCQDYSVAGNRGGLAGDRGALWWEYLRLIIGLRPTWVIAENVPGLLSSRDGKDFETIVGSLTERGYGVAWAVLDAQYFGVAQRRRRVFIVGHSGGRPRPEILALSEGLFGHPAPRRETGERTAPTLAARTRGGGFPGTDEAIDGALAFMWQAGGNNSASGAWEREYTPTLPVKQTVAVAFAQNQRDEVRDLGDQAGALAAEPGMKQQTYIAIQDTTRLTKDQNGAGISQEDLGYTLDGQSRPGVVAIQGTTIGRSDEAGPAGKGWDDSGSMFTLETIAPHGVAASTSVRRLTPLECERLQGFPDGWTDIPGNSDTQRYRQLGNAVAVPVVEWIMRRVSDATS